METEKAIAALGALAQESRLNVFRTLVRAGPQGVAAGELADTLDLAPATLSFHLKELRQAGLVRCERRGRTRRYSPDFECMNALLGYLTANCCQGLEGAGQSGSSCDC